MPTLVERFEAKFVRGGSDECWLWVAGTNNSGYGTFQKSSYYAIGAHVMAWEIDNDQDVPEDGEILHTCDNRLCVNPHHLLLGTPQLNTLDSVHKNRHYEAAKTHCDRGHEFSPENTYITPSTGGRRCRICMRQDYGRRI